MSTIAAKGRGEKENISTRTIPPSSALLPWIDLSILSQRVSIIQYPEILSLRSTPKANISQPSKYIPYISHAHPIHLYAKKKIKEPSPPPTIDRFTPKSVLTINISIKNPSQPNPNHAPLPPPLPPLFPPPLPPHHRPKTPPRLHLAQPHPNHPSTLQIQFLHQPRPARKRSRPQHNPQSQPPGRHSFFFRDQNWRNHT